ncbi:hypothetical protein CYF35_14055 [Salmonella enterica]|nr:hypothetical protein [Salmonella enterica]
MRYRLASPTKSNPIRSRIIQCPPGFFVLQVNQYSAGKSLGPVQEMSGSVLPTAPPTFQMP